MKSKIQKLSALFLAFILVATPFAKAVETPSIGLQMMYMQSWDCTLSISGKTATVKASVSGYSSLTTKSSVTVQLQEQSGSRWVTVATWTDSVDGRRASVNETYSVTSGKTYRAVATCTVWSGSSSETETVTTANKKA